MLPRERSFSRRARRTKVQRPNYDPAGYFLACVVLAAGDTFYRIAVCAEDGFQLVYCERLLCEVSKSATRDSASDDFTAIKEGEVDAVNLSEMGETASAGQWHGKRPCEKCPCVKYD